MSFLFWNHKQVNNWINKEVQITSNQWLRLTEEQTSQVKFQVKRHGSFKVSTTWPVLMHFNITERLNIYMWANMFHIKSVLRKIIIICAVEIITFTTIKRWHSTSPQLFFHLKILNMWHLCAKSGLKGWLLVIGEENTLLVTRKSTQLHSTNTASQTPNHWDHVIKQKISQSHSKELHFTADVFMTGRLE